MNQISLDMYQTLGMAVAVLFLGAFLKKRIKFLETFCIPSPVVGGLIFAIVSCILYATGILEISFDETLKNVCMVIFFTSVGFQANLKVLKSGGLSLVVFLVCVIVLIISQNLVSVGLAKLVGVSPPIDGTVADRLTEQYNGYVKHTIKANTYDGQTEDIKTLGVKMVLIASDKMSDDRVKSITKNIFDNSNKFGFAKDDTFDMNFATENITIPFHKGASEYYAENGVNVATK